MCLKEVILKALFLLLVTPLHAQLWRVFTPIRHHQTTLIQKCKKLCSSLSNTTEYINFIHLDWVVSPPFCWHSRKFCCIGPRTLFPVNNFFLHSNETKGCVLFWFRGLFLFPSFKFFCQCFCIPIITSRSPIKAPLKIWGVLPMRMRIVDAWVGLRIAELA